MAMSGCRRSSFDLFHVLRWHLSHYPPDALTGPPDQAGWEPQPFFPPAGTGLGACCRCRDLAILDEHGYCKIIGRCKDMIIRGGENIYPAELEQFLHTHPKVEEVQVSRREVGGVSGRGSCRGKPVQKATGTAA